MKYLVICIVLAVSVPAAADPAAPVMVDFTKPVKLMTPATLTTEGGSVILTPPGRFLREDLWSKIDTEARRLQDAEVRLTAENASLRKSTDGWPSWRTLAITLATGVALGVYIDRRL